MCPDNWPLPLPLFVKVRVPESNCTSGAPLDGNSQLRLITENGRLAIQTNANFTRASIRDSSSLRTRCSAKYCSFECVPPRGSISSKSSACKRLAVVTSASTSARNRWRSIARSLSTLLCAFTSVGENIFGPNQISTIQWLDSWAVSC